MLLAPWSSSQSPTSKDKQHLLPPHNLHKSADREATALQENQQQSVSAQPKEMHLRPVDLAQSR